MGKGVSDRATCLAILKQGLFGGEDVSGKSLTQSLTQKKKGISRF